MFDKETLTALQEGSAILRAAGALAAHHDTNNLAALPSDYKLHDLEPYLAGRRRARGTMATAQLASFAEYVIAHAEAGATVFVDQKTITATAVLNLGEAAEPGHADNKAALTPERTAAYTALLQHANGSAYSQKAIAEWMEDWADNIIAFAADGAEIKTTQAVAAVRKITIDAMRKIESTEQSLSASKSAFESIQASSTETLPALILFSCQPYADLDQRSFALRLGVLTGDATPKVNLRISKMEEHAEQMATELAELITSAFAADSVPVLLGSYSRDM